MTRDESHALLDRAAACWAGTIRFERPSTGTTPDDTAERYAPKIEASR